MHDAGVWYLLDTTRCADDSQCLSEARFAQALDKEDSKGTGKDRRNVSAFAWGFSRHLFPGKEGAR